MYRLIKIFHPERFQGKYKKKNYFEGWYFKLIDAGQRNALAIIPGVCFDKEGKDSHAFIQVLDAHRSKVHYLRYPLSQFTYREDAFLVEIHKNYFTGKEIRLDIDRDGVRMKGELQFEQIVPYPKSLTKPGIMGPYSFIPFMECYHGIVNIHHRISGIMNHSGTAIDFGNGYGYIEKDWGTSFPEDWIWMQSNHFPGEDVSLMFSVAKIPWFGTHFIGFISFLRIGKEIHHFASYTNAIISSLEYRDDALHILMEDRQHRMEIKAEHSAGGVLKAPKNGLMSMEILESISAVVHVKLQQKDGTTLYQGTGKNTGMKISAGILKHF